VGRRVNEVMPDPVGKNPISDCPAGVCIDPAGGERVDRLTLLMLAVPFLATAT
jgi:hypothetical protein